MMNSYQKKIIYIVLLLILIVISSVFVYLNQMQKRRINNRISVLEDNYLPRKQKIEEKKVTGLCSEIMAGTNKEGEKKLNFVFVGFDIKEKKQLLEKILPLYADFEGNGLKEESKVNQIIGHDEDGEPVYGKKDSVNTYYGLFGTKPFSNHQNTINLWFYSEDKAIKNLSEFGDRVPKVKDRFGNMVTTTMRCNALCDINPEEIEKKCQLKNVYPVIICNTKCSAFGSWTTKVAYLSFPYNSENKFIPSQIRTFLHELGHSFGALRDEYIKLNSQNQPGMPNCAPDKETANKWWGDLVGQGEGDYEIGYFQGCSYSKNNIRPTKGSIMLSTFDYQDFGLVNERELEKKLNQFE